MHRLAVEVAPANEGPLGVDTRAEHARQHQSTIECGRGGEGRLEILQLILKKREMTCPLLVAVTMRWKATQPAGGVVAVGQVAP